MSSVCFSVQGTTGHSMSCYSLYNQKVHCLSCYGSLENGTGYRGDCNESLSFLHNPADKKKNSHLLIIALPESKHDFAGSFFPEELCLCVCVCVNELENILRHMTNVFCLFLSLFQVTE